MGIREGAHGVSWATPHETEAGSGAGASTDEDNRGTLCRGAGVAIVNASTAENEGISKGYQGTGGDRKS